MCVLYDALLCVPYALRNTCTICSENVYSICSADYCKFLSTCSLLLLVNCLLPQLNVCSGKSKVGILGKCFKRYYNSIKQKPPISHPDWDCVNMTVNFRAPLYSKAAGNGKGIYNSILIRWFVDLGGMHILHIADISHYRHYWR